MFHCNPPGGVHNSPREGEDLLHNSDSKITPFIIPEVKITAGRAGMIANKGWNVACSHRSSGVIRARSLDLRDSPARWIIYSWSFDPWEFASAAASQWDLYDVIYDLRRPVYDVALHMLSLYALSLSLCSWLNRSHPSLAATLISARVKIPSLSLLLGSSLTPDPRGYFGRVRARAWEFAEVGRDVAVNESVIYWPDLNVLTDTSGVCK